MDKPNLERNVKPNLNLQYYLSYDYGWEDDNSYSNLNEIKENIKYRLSRNTDVTLTIVFHNGKFKDFILYKFYDWNYEKIVNKNKYINYVITNLHKKIMER